MDNELKGYCRKRPQPTLSPYDCIFLKKISKYTKYLRIIGLWPSFQFATYKCVPRSTFYEKPMMLGWQEVTMIIMSVLLVFETVTVEDDQQTLGIKRSNSTGYRTMRCLGSSVTSGIPVSVDRVWKRPRPSCLQYDIGLVICFLVLNRHLLNCIALHGRMTMYHDLKSLQKDQGEIPETSIRTAGHWADISAQIFRL